MAEKPQPKKALVGYDDTPFLQDSKWRVHDSKRPQPRIVTPGTSSAQDKPGLAPSDAITLFNGADVSKWVKVGGGKVGWKVEAGHMEVVPATGNIETKEHFGDCQLHVEWAAPTEISKESQSRGNSGVFMMGQYEIQVLDCYQNISYADGLTAAIYGQYPPLVNACRKPGVWQTYDVFFAPPRWEGQKLLTPAYITVIHNGVLVHHHQALQGPTRHRTTASYDVPHGSTGPIMLQDHKDPVRFRNIWIRPLKGYDQE